MKHQEFDDISYQDLARFFEGESTEAEVQTIAAWKEKSEEHKHFFATCKMIWVESTSLHFNDSEVPEVDVVAAWSKVRETISDKPTKTLRLQPLMRVAAIIAVVMTIGYFVISQFFQSPTLVRVEAADDIKELVLNDGSQVELNKSSTLVYKEGLKGDTREVELTGEAFFNIAKDSAKPFVIRTNAVAIKVLGTSFNVDSKVKDSVEVQVETGVVELAYNEQKIVLHAGETGVYYQSLGKLLKRESRVVVSQFWRNRKLNFRRTELSEIVETLNKLYDVNIRVDDVKEQHRRLNVKFEDQDIDLILDVLSNTLDLRIRETENGEIILYREE